MPPSQPRYTERGDDHVEGVIAALIEDARASAAEVPGVTALLLGGSLGRGEASLRHGPDGDVLISDVELYLVGPSRRLRRAAKRLQRDLSARHGLDVSMAWVSPATLRTGRAKNLSWQFAPTIRHYELAASGRTLLGVSPPMAEVDPAALPLAEGVRLILNRLAEAAPLLAATQEATGDPDPRAAYWTDKILMACGDTLLLAQHAYHVSYRQRHARLAELAEPWPMPPEWRDTIRSAFERKLSGREVGVDDAPANLPAIVRACLDPALRAAGGVALEPLATLPSRLGAAGHRHPQLLRYLPPVGALPQYEAFVTLARTVAARLPVSQSVIVDVARGRPLSLTTLAVAAWVFFAITAGDSGAAEQIAARMRAAGMRARPAVGLPGLADLNKHYWSVVS